MLKTYPQPPVPFSSRASCEAPSWNPSDVPNHLVHSADTMTFAHNLTAFSAVCCGSYKQTSAEAAIPNSSICELSLNRVNYSIHLPLQEGRE